MGTGQLRQHLLSAFSQLHPNSPPVIGIRFASHILFQHEAIDQANGAMMGDLQLLRQFTDCHGVAIRKSFYREQRLMLLWAQPRTARRLFAKSQELPQRETESSEGFVVGFGHDG